MVLEFGHEMGCIWGRFNKRMKIALATCVAEKDLERLSVLRYSLSHFWPSQHHYLFVENDETFASCKHYPNTLVHPQECLLPRNEVNGWHYQQLIKLLVTSKLTDYDYVLWLDCDQLLLRPFDLSLLEKEGKAKCQWTNVWAPDWMQVTESILHCKRFSSQPQVSACLLSPVVCQHLSDYLENKYQQDWLTYLTKLHFNRVLWTEYSLYYCYAKVSKLYDTYHANGSYLAPGYNLNSSLESFDFKRLWLNPSSLFTVLESNTKIPPSLTLDIFNEWVLSNLWKTP